MRCLLAICICMILRNCASAQELQTWISSNGHKTEAQFLRLNETAGTITLLIPRTIRLDQLDPDSIALARKLAATTETPISQFNAVGNDHWPTTSAGSVAKPISTLFQTRTEANDFVGETRYIHGILVWGVGDFRWYDPSIEVPDDPAKIKIQMKRYGVEKMPNKAAVTLVGRRRHPASGTWVYQVKFNGSLYWVLSDELRDSL